MGFFSQEEIETVIVEAINCNGQRATMTVISAGFLQLQHNYSPFFAGPSGSS